MQVMLKLKKKRRNNVSRSKQTTTKVPSNLFRDFEEAKKVRLIFLRPKDKMKSKCYVFSSYKQTNKVWFVYLQCKLQQESCAWCTS